MRTRWMPRALGAVTAAGLLGLGPCGTADAQAAPATTPGSPAASCFAEDFCLFSSPDYAGTKHAYYVCNDMIENELGLGSYIDNLPAGTKATFYETDGRTITITAPASDPSFDFTDVYRIKTC